MWRLNTAAANILRREANLRLILHPLLPKPLPRLHLKPLRPNLFPLRKATDHLRILHNDEFNIFNKRFPKISGNRLLYNEPPVTAAASVAYSDIILPVFYRYILDVKKY